MIFLEFSAKFAQYFVNLKLFSNVLTGASFFKFTFIEPNSKKASTSETLMPALIIMPSMITGFISALINELKPMTVVNIAQKDGENLSRSVR